MADIKEQLFALNKASRESVALYHRFALSAGVSDSSLGVLYALAATDRRFTQYDLCNEWSIPKQTVNSTVSALQKRGLISLTPVSGTRNKKYLALTDEGRRFALSCVGGLLDAEVGALSDLSPEERELYIRLNGKYNAALAKRVASIIKD